MRYRGWAGFIVKSLNIYDEVTKRWSELKMEEKKFRKL